MLSALHSTKVEEFGPYQLSVSDSGLCHNSSPPTSDFAKLWSAILQSGHAKVFLNVFINVHFQCTSDSFHVNLGNSSVQFFHRHSKHHTRLLEGPESLPESVFNMGNCLPGKIVVQICR